MTEEEVPLPPQLAERFDLHVLYVLHSLDSTGFY
jgi:hypothetical protein